MCDTMSLSATDQGWYHSFGGLGVATTPGATSHFYLRQD